MRRCLCSGSHQRKQELVKELQRSGVLFDVRKLNVGDFLWVAREKVSPVSGSMLFVLLSASKILNRKVQNGFFCSVSRSAAGACRQGACPWLHHREEEDRRPLQQHYRRPLQGTEGWRVPFYIFWLSIDKLLLSFAQVKSFLTALSCCSLSMFPPTPKVIFWTHSATLGVIPAIFFCKWLLHLW